MAKIEVKCFTYNDFGQGVFKVGKDIGYASNLLVGEVALADKDKKGKYYISSFIKKSKERVEPKCEHYLKCGSCHLLHMNDKAQENFKKDYVESCFREYKIPFKLDKYVSSLVKEGYRNKMQVAFGIKEGKIVYGFYEEDSHRIIPLKKCLVQSDRQNEIVKVVCDIIKELRLQVYQEDKRTGLIRFVMIREGYYSKEILVTIVTNSDIFPGRNEFVKRLKARCPYITSIVQNVNTRKTSIILGDEERVLYGPGYINDTLSGINFKISSKTFYQINPRQTEILYSIVKEYANLTGCEKVLDAYCGVGTIGMILSKNAKRVIGVENNKQSVLNARVNAKENKITNMSFVCDDATNYILNTDEKFDVLIMDPPRCGSTKEFLHAVEEMKVPKIVYVSCEAKTLARDISMLKNYKVEKVSLVDMFACTYHVETVCLLSRKDSV